MRSGAFTLSCLHAHGSYFRSALPVLLLSVTSARGFFPSSALPPPDLYPLGALPTSLASCNFGPLCFAPPPPGLYLPGVLTSGFAPIRPGFVPRAVFSTSMPLFSLSLGHALDFNHPGSTTLSTTSGSRQPKGLHYPQLFPGALPIRLDALVLAQPGPALEIMPYPVLPSISVRTKYSRCCVRSLGHPK
jgi:hypothetical protein